MSSNIIYTEKHHVIPRHLRGTCPLLDLIINDKSNLIALTVPEHAEAHRVLYEEYGRWQDELAWLTISGRIGKEEIQVLISSENGKKCRGRKKPPRTEEHRKNLSLAAKGRKLTVETKKKMSLAKKGKKMPPFTEEHKKKLSLAGKGRKVTEETRKKQSLANKGRKLTEETKKNLSLANKGVILPKSPCPRCGRLLDAGNMPRHLRKKVPCMASNDAPEDYQVRV